ncbi:Uncharacterised protein [Pseudomonas putida]|jgi:hypothetical protein|uniref:hypothetical protein n=1 Tax=Pseudomonas sp. HTZ2 TaxID=3075220 RepID=UPI001F87019D|nr:hypothetical protein [Pseudomonas sp. HTZ2]CAB5581784.1 Uncharacterised protein [Pseudomonas putida]CAB5584543.1 Uncharacterised protein [Pseudomonas putida]CAB5625937.1 Uncharacterised protein [Pseudomonas putida]CAB5626186.1 Uncharacterised protein [Pseudomonas putida]CAB5704328.1 Uncharacterised protein [Pseudomonas putida]
MPIITVTTTVITRFDVPEGVGIDLIRHQALPVLSEDEEGTDEVGNLQDTALNMVFLGDADPQSRTVEHYIVEGGDHP